MVRHVGYDAGFRHEEDPQGGNSHVESDSEEVFGSDWAVIWAVDYREVALVYSVRLVDRERSDDNRESGDASCFVCRDREVLLSVHMRGLDVRKDQNDGQHVVIPVWPRLGGNDACPKETAEPGKNHFASGMWANVG